MCAALAVATSLLLTAGAAQAQTSEDAEREADYVRVVQPQPFSRDGRLSIAPLFAFSINDPLVQTLTVGASLTYFVKDSLGITGGFHYAFDVKRGAQNALLSQQLRPELNPLQWVGTLGVEWVPIYGKFALFNGPVVHWDTFLTLGGGVQNTLHGGLGPTGVAGVGTRIFLTPWLTVTVDVRDYLYSESFVGSDRKDKSNFLNNLLFGVGLSFFVPSRSGQ